TTRLAHLAGLLHDIGKIGIPGSILNKTERLTDDEFEEMKNHAVIGADILGEVDSYGEISTLVRHHHERIDGAGYPDQIGGDFIPAISRMISVADTYSAMTTDRPYRQGMPTEKAMAILGEASGSGQLDEMYTAVFLRILRNADPLYQRGKQTSFEVEVAKHEALGEFEQRVLHDDVPTSVPDITIVVTDDEIQKDAA
ncbi:MAG: HD domain-containing protein, partial [Thermoleophilia bacterium]|nr:HD domain-containing protein [Thermoleophilia bacterium]